MNSARPLAAVIWAIVPISVAVGQMPRTNIDHASLSALKTWVAAVRAHIPGEADTSVVTVARFSYKTREDLNSGIGLFFAALMGWRYDTGNNKAAQEIAAAGHAAGKDFLKQAAVLHSDAAAYLELFPSASTSASKAPPQRPRVSGLTMGRRPLEAPPPPLLREETMLMNEDGQIIGYAASSWNWPFARSLLDLLGAGSARRIFSDGRPPLATDPFIGAWYHATTAYMFANGLYGTATFHLAHASMILPDDPRVLFDRGCYAEILGLPMQQATMWTSSAVGLRPNIPSPETTNADAERLFRRALAIDPSLVEARVRLARLLRVRGRHEEAGVELKTALAANPTEIVRYYAHLFAGRTMQTLGQMGEAARHFREASLLYPDAQSALLAASQLALLQSDVTAALGPVERLGPRSNEFTADPWWQYHLAAGRDAEELLKALWARVPRAR